MQFLCWLKVSFIGQINQSPIAVSRWYCWKIYLHLHCECPQRSSQLSGEAFPPDPLRRRPVIFLWYPPHSRISIDTLKEFSDKLDTDTILIDVSRRGAKSSKVKSGQSSTRSSVECPRSGLETDLHGSCLARTLVTEFVCSLLRLRQPRRRQCARSILT